ncbi:hypothetical protein DPEC_G00270480 [Dallia pectoralis]|uniref:Uncharacterized protein n=1 Tax=Dallia pectoralis TaxID=75939 RepID=A0ACC2FP92_DALPE|nr:hypothetical protein DPEC_G00270480 [Dallia pectoralis]
MLACWGGGRSTGRTNNEFNSPLSWVRLGTGGEVPDAETEDKKVRSISETHPEAPGSSPRVLGRAAAPRNPDIGYPLLFPSGREKDSVIELLRGEIFNHHLERDY